MENGVYNFGRTSFSKDRDIGFRFISNSTSTLDQIVVPVLAYPERNNLREAVFWIMTENNDRPDAIIDSFYFTAPTGPIFNPSSNFPLAFLNSSLHPLLYEGTPYYLVASDNFGLTNRPTEENAFAWEIEKTEHLTNIITWRDTDIPNGFYGFWGSSNTEFSPQARILGSPVPEPATFALFGVSLLGTFIRKKFTR